MKILLVSPQNPLPANDGGKKSIYHLAEELCRTNEVILSFPINNKVEELANLSKGIKFKIAPFRIETSDSVIKLIQSIGTIYPFKIFKYINKGYLKFLEKLVDENEVELIQVHHLHMAFYGNKLAKRSGVKVVLREHNVESELVRQYYYYSRGIRKVFAYWQYLKTVKYETKIWSKYSTIIFISKSDLNLASKRIKKGKIYSINDGVYNIAGEEITKTRNSLIFSGSINTIQNYYSILWFIKEVWPLVIDQNKKARLYLTGGGHKKLIKDKHINFYFKGNSILPLGYVEDIDKEITSKELFISPTQFGSGLRIKVLHALSLAMPVICTSLDLEGLNYFSVGKNIVRADEPAEFASAIINLLNNHNVRKNLAKEAEILIRDNYNWSSIIKQYELAFSEAP